MQPQSSHMSAEAGESSLFPTVSSSQKQGQTHMKAEYGSEAAASTCTTDDQDETKHSSLPVTPDMQPQASDDASKDPTAGTATFFAQHGSEGLRQIAFDLEQHETSPFSPVPSTVSTPGKPTTALFEKADELLGGRSGPFSPGSVHGRKLPAASQGSIRPAINVGRSPHSIPTKKSSSGVTGNEHESCNSSPSDTSPTESSSQRQRVVTNTGSQTGNDGASAAFISQQTPGELNFDFQFPAVPRARPTDALVITFPAVETAVHQRQNPSVPEYPFFEAGHSSAVSDSSAYDHKSHSVSSAQPNSPYSSSVWVHENIARSDQTSRTNKSDVTRPAHTLFKSCSLEHLRPAQLSKHAHANEDDIHPALRSTPYFNPADSVILSEDAPGPSRRAAYSEEKCAAEDGTKKRMNDTKPQHALDRPAPYLQDKREAVVYKSTAHLRPQAAQAYLQYEDTSGRMHTTPATPDRPRKSHHVTKSSCSYSGYRGPELAPTYEMNERLSSFVSSPDFHAQASLTEHTPLRPRASSPTLGTSSPVIYDPFAGNPFQLAAAYTSRRPFNERSPSFKSDHSSARNKLNERSNSLKSGHSSQASDPRTGAHNIRLVDTPPDGNTAGETITRTDFSRWPERTSSATTTPAPAPAPAPVPAPQQTRPFWGGGDGYNQNWEADGWWNPFHVTDPMWDPATVPGRRSYFPRLHASPPQRAAPEVYVPTGGPGSVAAQGGAGSQDTGKVGRSLSRKFSMSKVLKESKDGVKKLLRREKKK